MNPNLGYEPSKALITDEIELEAKAQLRPLQEVGDTRRVRWPKEAGSLQQRHTLSKRC